MGICFATTLSSQIMTESVSVVRLFVRKDIELDISMSVLYI